MGNVLVVVAIYYLIIISLLFYTFEALLVFCAFLGSAGGFGHRDLLTIGTPGRGAAGVGGF